MYLEESIGKEDKSLRDYFYNGILGKFYQFLMPFLTLPARPINKSKRDWGVYFLTVTLVVLLIYKISHIIFGYNPFDTFTSAFFNVLSIGALTLIFLFFIKHPYFFYLLILAIPVKISLSIKKFHPKKGFLETHRELIENLLKTKQHKLQILDISTGTGNSLFRHGWMKLDADYTGLDLSETMLSQCQEFMSQKNVPIDLVIGDATTLPFSDAYFDVVLNYGAVNGYSDIKKALSEMSRVVKKDGLVLFLDEQLYPNASMIEKLYFKKVLSSHNLIHQCPVDLLPENARNISVYQVYEFYYVCVFTVK
ncbi:MAG: class I SAM-dependent methyltransferase [Nitrosopumilus sp.]|nr:class I SAM-dependent methyltransferase [Nitrosopumilus sp.]